MLRFLAARQIHGQNLHLSPAETEAAKAQFHQTLLSLRDKAAQATKKVEIHQCLGAIEMCLGQLHNFQYQVDQSVARNILNTGTRSSYSFHLHTLTDLMQCSLANADEGRLMLQCLANYYLGQPYSEKRDASVFVDFFFKFLIKFHESLLQTADIIDLHWLLNQNAQAQGTSFFTIANIHVTNNNHVLELSFSDGNRALSDFLPANRFYRLFFAVETYNQLRLKHHSQRGSRANTRLFATPELSTIHQQLIKILDDYITDKGKPNQLSEQEIELFDTLANSIYITISEKAKTILSGYQCKHKAFGQ
jgi:hypothetical protein